MKSLKSDPRLNCVVACLDLKDGEDENENWRVWSKYFDNHDIKYDQMNPGYCRFCGYMDDDKAVYTNVRFFKLNEHIILEYNVSGEHIDTKLSAESIKELLTPNEVPVFFESSVDELIKYVKDLQSPPKIPVKSYDEAEFDEQYEQFTKDGCISSNMECYCICNERNKLADPRIASVLYHRDKRNELVSSVKCTNQDNPFEKELQLGKYTFQRLDYTGRHVIDLKRPSIDRFYLTVGVQYNGDFWKDGDSVTRTGYYLVETNGHYNDVKEAVESTQHLW